MKILETRSEESSSAELKSKCKHELHKNDVDRTRLLDSSDRQLVSIYKPRRCAAAALDFRVLNAISSSLPAVESTADFILFYLYFGYPHWP
jgi:hypothetical protein